MGQDIVCSAVSALYQTFLLSVREITGKPLFTSDTENKHIVNIGTLQGIEEKTLLESFFIGINAISESYGDYLQVEALPTVKLGESKP